MDLRCMRSGAEFVAFVSVTLGLGWVLLACALAAFCATASAQSTPTALREEVLMLRKPGFFSLEIEATLFRPPGEGPHRLLVINHGKAPGDPRFQPRARYTLVARELVERGYAVVIPMRQGFSKSSGAYIGGGCNVGSNGLAQADDVQFVLDALGQRADIDVRRVVVIGQSHGGLTTLAIGTLKLPNVVGLVSFAGGLRNDSCPGWEGTLARAVGDYASDTVIPSLWFYGDNDSYFPPRIWQEMHLRYTERGGRARLIAFGSFGSDAHALFGGRAGWSIWLPEVERFFRELNLPFDKQDAIGRIDHELPARSVVDDGVARSAR